MDSFLLKTLPTISGRSGWPWIEHNEVISVQKTHLPRISIITPSFNQGAYLEETIRSIILQGYPNYELIIIDAGSNDNTVEVIKKYEAWITYWVSEPDRGQSHAIQKGLAHVTGDIVNWLNSDDLLAPGAFHALAREFDSERYDVICGRCDFFVNDLAHLDLRNERMGIGNTVGETILAGKINQPSTFFKTSILKDLGIDEAFHFTMDLELWYRYILKNGQSRILISDSLLTYFRLHETSKTVSLSPRFAVDAAKVLYNMLLSLNQPEYLLDFIKKDITDDSFVPKRYEITVDAKELSSLVLHYAWQALVFYNENRNRKAARVCLILAIKYGQPITISTVRQLVKHQVLPTINW